MASVATRSAEESSPSEPTIKAIARAKSLLAAAQQRPIIVTGLGLEPETLCGFTGICRSSAGGLLLAKRKGSLPSDHKLFVGTIGLTHTDPAYEVLDEADCIVTVGFDVVELVKLWEQNAPLIWIAPWENEDPLISTEVEFVGPMRPVLEQLSDGLFATESNWGEKRVAMYRQTKQQKILPQPQVGRLWPQSVLQSIRQVVARDTLVTTDVGPIRSTLRLAGLLIHRIDTWSRMVFLPWGLV